MQGLFKAAYMDDEEVQETAMQALAEIPNIAYNEIVGDIQAMGELTNNLMTAKKFVALRQAMHFWTNVCTVELGMLAKNQDAKIITNCYPSLIDIVFGCMEFTELDLEEGTDIEDTADDE
jgi:hypothetical protein